MSPTCNLKKANIFFIAFFFFYSAHAQNSITGKIITPDSKPIANANVLLLNSTDTSLIKGDVTNSSGQFSFQNIVDGKYLISCSFIGFETRYLPDIKLPAKTLVLDIGEVSLKTDAVNLNSVTVIGKKPMFEQKIDRMIVNVKNSITSAGLVH